MMMMISEWRSEWRRQPLYVKGAWEGLSTYTHWAIFIIVVIKYSYHHYCQEITFFKLYYVLSGKYCAGTIVATNNLSFVQLISFCPGYCYNLSPGSFSTSACDRERWRYKRWDAEQMYLARVLCLLEERGFPKLSSHWNLNWGLNRWTPTQKDLFFIFFLFPISCGIFRNSPSLSSINPIEKPVLVAFFHSCLQQKQMFPWVLVAAQYLP